MPFGLTFIFFCWITKSGFLVRDKQHFETSAVHVSSLMWEILTVKYVA